jgi:uncharacterized protein
MYATISAALKLPEKQVRAVAGLLEQGATVPFIARYRKEISGGMDEVAVAAVRDLAASLKALETRRDVVLRSLEERGLLTPELRSEVEGAETLTRLEDVYLPFRPKRRNRAVIAEERGLAPLADRLLEQRGADPVAMAREFVAPDKGVQSPEDALQGARDIIAQRASEDLETREDVRRLFRREAVYDCRVVPGKEEEGRKFRDWFAWREPVSKTPSHRVLAMRRGEKELFLNLSVTVHEDRALALLEKRFLRRGETPEAAHVVQALTDGFRRLLGPQMETEARAESKERADREAVRLFALNLENLLMAPPLGRRRVAGVDPGLRTGCKVAVLDPQGALLHHGVFMLHREREARAMLVSMQDRFRPEFIAVGNGTGGRETEAFLRGIGLEARVVMVSESGASVYSASKEARDEFPDLDLTVRGAVSIGRRLQDPLAELVKIDPWSIGVGQYQHDVDPGLLKRSLDDTVMKCVNSVGVELNTASARLLTYVSGLGSRTARAVVDHRNANGPFESREQLLMVPGIGPATFQQCAGFLRIPGGKEPLDASAVHPERYGLVRRMAADLGTDVAGLMADQGLRRSVVRERYLSDDAGLPTLNDILAELDKPGRDPRSVFQARGFADVHRLEDLKEGMTLPGTVTNVTGFGAFVDVGVHTDGLVHISRLGSGYVGHPSDVVSVGMWVTVNVIGVDLERGRLSLAMVEGTGSP